MAKAHTKELFSFARISETGQWEIVTWHKYTQCGCKYATREPFKPTVEQLAAIDCYGEIQLPKAA